MLRSKHCHLLRGRTDHHGSATTTAADKHTQALVPRKFLGVLSLPHVNMLALSRPPESRGRKEESEEPSLVVATRKRKCKIPTSYPRYNRGVQEEKREIPKMGTLRVRSDRTRKKRKGRKHDKRARESPLVLVPFGRESQKEIELSPCNTKKG